MTTITKTIVVAKHGRAVTDSRIVASYFGKRHDHALRDIDDLISTAPSIAPNFGAIEMETKVGFGARRDRAFDMTKDGFTLLATGFTGPKALRFKIDYIQRFNEMEVALMRSGHFGALPTFPVYRPAQPLNAAQRLPAISLRRDYPTLMHNETSPLRGALSRTLQMNALTNITTSPVVTMSSLEIAGLVEARHDNVKVTVERLVKRGVIVQPAMQDEQNTTSLVAPAQSKST